MICFQLPDAWCIRDMDLALSLDADSKEPLYRQLGDAIRTAIVSGALKPGEKLPSSRALADSMSISRDTASRTYTELASQGFIRVIAGSGVVVNEDCPVLFVQNPLAKQTHELPAVPTDIVRPPTTRLSSFGNRIMEVEELGSLTPFLQPEFNYDAPNADELPIKRWREVLAKSSHLEEESLRPYTTDPFGYRPLREALVSYLGRRRGIVCSADQIAIFNSTEGGTDMLCRVLLEPGDYMAVENPGSPGVRLTFAAHGAQMIPIPVDEHGIVVSELRKRTEPIRLLYLTPSYQDPTGVPLSEPRRKELLEWAKQTGAIIIEDDFDSEFRYGQRPVRALKGLDEDSDSVALRYNFWRGLFPLVRMSFLVMPKRLVPIIWRMKALSERDVPILEQHALSEFITDGHLERHMRRTLSRYARRRAALVQSLNRHLRDAIKISPVSAGMHVIVTFQSDVEAQHVIACARKAGLPVRTTTFYYWYNAPVNEFIIGFAYTDENDIPETVAKFCKFLNIKL